MSKRNLENELNFSEKESKVFMPNEIFEDLQDSIKKSSHISFGYSYIYLCTWLYRYIKYYNVKMFNGEDIKNILGYSKNNKTMNYIMKKDGLLEKMEYLKSTKNFPIGWEYENEDLSFIMFDEYLDLKDVFLSLPKRYFIKKPLKGFFRYVTEGDILYETIGTFFEVDNTHNIPFEVFLFCMNNSEIGCTGFYLYSFLKYKCDLFKSGYDISLVNLSKQIKISERSLDKYLSLLKSYRMIDFYHNQDYFAVGMLKEDKKANTYIVREFDFFSDEKIPFEKIQIISKSDYLSLVEKRNEKKEVEKIYFNKENLPF